MNCQICPTNCCTASSKKAKGPILFPHELLRFHGRTSYDPKDMGYLRLAKEPNGNCVSLNAINRCVVYKERPLLCRLYPWRITYQNGVAVLVLDREGCPQAPYMARPRLPKCVTRLPSTWWENWEKVNA